MKAKIIKITLTIVFMLISFFLFSSGLVFSEETAIQELNQGIQYYNDFEYEKAISSLENALKGALDKFDKIKCYQLLALCYDALSDSQKMNDAFSQILDIDLSYQTPSDFPPRLTDAITQLRLKKTIVEVASNPSGAKIIVDGKETPKSTPSKFTADELGSGTHTISASLAKYSAESQTVSVYPGKSLKVEIKLSQLPEAPLDKEKPKISLSALIETFKIDKDLQIKAKVADNLKVASVKMFYKLPQTNFVAVNMESVGKDEYQFTIPKGFLKKGKLEFYIEADDEAGNSEKAASRFIDLKEAGGGKTWLWLGLGTIAAGSGAAAYALSSGGGGGPTPEEPPPTPPAASNTGSISFVIDF